MLLQHFRKHFNLMENAEKTAKTNYIEADFDGVMGRI